MEGGSAFAESPLQRLAVDFLVFGSLLSTFQVPGFPAALTGGKFFSSSKKALLRSGPLRGLTFLLLPKKWSEGSGSFGNLAALKT